MTKYTFLKTIALGMMLIVGANQLSAQSVNNGIFFQAVARDNFSNPAKERKIYVQSSVIQTTTNGPSLLVEQFQVNTDGNGMFSITIGNGTRVGGTVTGLNAIDWSQGPFFLNLKIAITPAAGNVGWDYTKEWVNIGTTSFGAVPYALYAASAAGVNQKLSITDTTKMLAPYATTANVTSLTTSVGSNTASISSLTTSVGSNTASISSLTSSVGLNTASISSLTTSVASNTASITANTLAFNSTIPYTGATGAVNLGAYDLKVNGLTVGRGAGGSSSNTAIGSNALFSNTTGSSNTASGVSTLYRNTTGQQNTANGQLALYSNIGGSLNTANGQGALLSNTEGSSNTASGQVALYNNTIGGSNTANGVQSLYSNTTGGSNTAIGSSSLRNNTTGSNNTSNGNESLYNNTIGGYNSAIGDRALFNNTTGSYNTALGNGADLVSNNLTNATAIGNGAIVAASNTIQLGNTSVTNVKTSGTITAGAITYPSTHGTNGQVLSTTGSGTLTFTSISSFTHYIGENYGGGIIVHLWKTSGVEHGLIAAKQDASTGITWSTITSGTSSATSYTDGQSNTNLIIAQNSGGASAAKVCADYTVTEGGVTYDDWYLPSASELGFIYQMKDTFDFFGGEAFQQGFSYHTSTESNSNASVIYRFDTFIGGRQSSNSKSNTYRVKAVRRF